METKKTEKIVWRDDVLMKLLISYAMGVWMGRYRLDKPGLHIAPSQSNKRRTCTL
jgi:hypothetical protein